MRNKLVSVIHIGGCKKIANILLYQRKWKTKLIYGGILTVQTKIHKKKTWIPSFRRDKMLFVNLHPVTKKAAETMYIREG